MTLTEAQKRAKKKWIEKNKDKYNEMQRKYALTYYYKNREQILEKKQGEYVSKKKIKIEESEEPPILDVENL